MRRTLAAATLLFVVFAGACSTRVYSSNTAIRDLERQSQVTHTQAKCIVNAIRKHFADAIVAAQKANKGSKLPADRLKLEIDDALAAIKEPKGSDKVATVDAIRRCAPGALK